MSEFAQINITEEMFSAWECRDIYLRQQIKFESFFCPFCGISLVARAIYKDEAGKSPHFATYPNKPHLHDCDGRPLGYHAVESVKLGKKTVQVPQNHPQEFTQRKPPRKMFDQSEGARMAVSRDLVQQRRAATASSSRHAPSSSNLSDFVQAYLGAIELWKEHSPGKPPDWKEVDLIRAAMRLKLTDETNYKDGFRKPFYIHKKPRIYYAQGAVTLKEQYVFLSSDVRTTFGEKSNVPFVVQLLPETLVISKPPLWHGKSLEKLIGFVETGKAIRWYAYGLPSFEDNVVILRPTSMDHIHFYALKNNRS